MSPPSPARQLFAETARQQDEEIDLAQAALLLAVEDDPDAAVEPIVAQLDQLAAGLEPELEGYPPRRQLETLAGYLHGSVGFHGVCSDDYYMPRNLLLTHVMANREGIPITLGLVYMEVGWRRGVNLQAVGLPGHLVLRHERDADAYLDPFAGDVLTAAICLERVLGPDYADLLAPEMLEPLGPRAFLLRLLNNLKGAYLRAEPPNLERALAASERILLLYPNAATELRDRGLLAFQLGRRIDALLDLERYLASEPEADDAPTIREHTRALYQLLSRLN